MSAKRLHINDGAMSDVANAVSWYRKRSPIAARNFSDELQRAIDMIQDAPERWPKGPHNTRRLLLTQFPLAVNYLTDESSTTIIAVAHGSRRPGYWTDRL